MAKYFALAIITATLALSGCNDSSNDSAGRDGQTSETVDKNPQIDADPTPETGTGGDSQSSSPDGTTNGAPAAK